MPTPPRPARASVSRKPARQARADFSPFVVWWKARTQAGLTTTEEKQLCVEGLKHGERATPSRWRAGPPSIVKETLQRSAATASCSRPQPVRALSGKPTCYVLRLGVPAFRWSASIRRPSTWRSYRIGDRKFVDTVIGHDFQRNINRSDAEQLVSEKGTEVWKGELKINPSSTLSVTTIPGRSGGRRSQGRRLRDDRRAETAASGKLQASLRRSGSSFSDLGADGVFGGTTALASSCIRSRLPTRKPVWKCA